MIAHRIWIKSFLEKVGQSSAMNRLMARLGLKGGSQDSAVGMSSRSSIGSFEGGPSSRDPIPHVTIAGGGPTTRRAQVHNYGGAQFWEKIITNATKMSQDVTRCHKLRTILHLSHKNGHKCHKRDTHAEKCFFIFIVGLVPTTWQSELVKRWRHEHDSSLRLTLTCKNVNAVIHIV